MKRLVPTCIASGVAAILMWAAFACGPKRSNARTERDPSVPPAESAVQSGSPQIAVKDDRANRLNEILKVVNNVSHVQTSHISQPLNEAEKQRIHASVDEIKDPTDLVSLALVCRAVKKYNLDYEEGFWHCVEQLSDDTSDKAVEQLNFLMQEVHPESGDKQLFEEALSYQQEKRRRQKK